MNATTLRTAILLTLALAEAGCGSNGQPGGGDDDDDNGSDAGVAPPDAVVPSVAPEIDGQLTINELMATNALTIRDDADGTSDWIELYNPTDTDIPLHGYRVTDVLDQALNAEIGPGVIAPAGGYLLLWLDDAPALGPAHLGVKLAADGGAVGLARPDGSYIDRLVYGAQEVDFAAARTPDGSDVWQVTWHPTPGAANATGDGAPMGLEVADAPPEEVPAAGDLSERILGYDEVPELALIVAPADAAALLADPFTYVPAQLVFAGRAYGPIGLRVKGQNSFEPFSQKPSLRINVDEYVEKARFFGLKDLTLNNMHSDFSMMHERLSYWVARQAGLPASRANHALLTVNGEPYGLYANVETVKRVMLGRWFSDTNGSLFESTDVDFAADYIADYDLESGPEDRSLLSGLATALTMPSADAAITAASSYIDLDQFLGYWAMCAVVGQLDAFPYSVPGDDYFVYADPTSGKLVVLPWGMDETFYAGQFDVLNTYSALAQRCKESPSCFQSYIDHVWDLLDFTDHIDLAGERVRVIGQIASYVAADTRKVYSDAEVASYQNALYWFIHDRRANLTAMLPPRSPL